MNCIEYKKLEKKVFIILTKYYLELENIYENMCDTETGISKETILETEKIMNKTNCLLNLIARNILIEEV